MSTTTAVSRSTAGQGREAGTRTTGARAARSRITGARATGARATGAHVTEALDRDALLDRLHQLRTVLPAFAQELADVRRTAAKLRMDNRRLLDEVHRLQKERGEVSAQRMTVV